MASMCLYGLRNLKIKKELSLDLDFIHALTEWQLRCRRSHIRWICSSWWTKTDVVAGAVDVVLLNGLGAVEGGHPNAFVVGGVLVPMANGVVEVTDAGRNG